MNEYKLTRTFNDKRTTTEKIEFQSFDDAVEEAGKWLKSEPDLESVEVENGEFKTTYTRPDGCKHNEQTWNADAGCMVCDECNEKVKV